MTRGFFVVADGTRIETAIYINGGAYPSYEGVKILEALTSQSGDPYQGALHYVAENQEEVKRCWNDGRYLSWDTFLAGVKKAGTSCINKGVDVDIDGKSFTVSCVEDYTYVFRKRRKSLDVYRNGKKLISVSADRFPLMKDIFSQWETIITSIAIDKDTFRLMPEAKAICALEDLIEEGAGFGEIMQAVSQNPKFHMVSYKCGNNTKLAVYYLQRNDDDYTWRSGFTVELTKNLWDSHYTGDAIFPHFAIEAIRGTLSPRSAKEFLARKLKAYLPKQDAFCELLFADNAIRRSIDRAETVLGNRVMSEEELQQMGDALELNAGRIKHALTELSDVKSGFALISGETIFKNFSSRLYLPVRNQHSGFGKCLEPIAERFYNENCAQQATL